MTIIKKNLEMCEQIIENLKGAEKITLAAREIFDDEQLEFFELDADAEIDILFESEQIVYTRNDNDWNDPIDFATDDYRNIDEETLIYWNSCMEEDVKIIINELKKNNIIEQLEEIGKINIDFIDYDLGLLIEVLEDEFNIKTEIQNLVGGQYLVRIGE